MKTADLKQFVRSNGFAWPGGYPMFLLMADGETIDAQSARENYRLIRNAMRSNDRRSDWMPAAVDIHYEGDPMICAHSGRSIESAYGNPEEQT